MNNIKLSVLLTLLILFGIGCSKDEPSDNKSSTNIVVVEEAKWDSGSWDQEIFE